MRLKLSFWNVRYGLNCRIIGPLRLRMTHDAKIIVGHHLTAIAGYKSTIVSSKKNVWSVEGGNLVIHNYVGMTSTSIYCNNN